MCIVQDSPEDWAPESATMGEVYKYSYCNIAATAAGDGRSGCFLKTNPLLARACRIKVTDTCPRASLPVRTYKLVDPELWSASLLEAPLNEGTWVVQERFLVPRILHFGKDQLFWECLELVCFH
jgi:hypothetical protein